jgi:iron complex outermembrane receptor protein
MIALVASPAHAQKANAAPSTGAVPSSNAADAAARPVSLQGFIVTARKRSERISDVGMSITAATQAELVEKGITTTEALTRIEPSLQYAQSPYGTPVYTIRGVGYFEQSLAATPAVSIYQDEVPYLYPVLAKGAMLDLDHAEILKGPQGILFGQNATGGAINFDAAQPTSSFAAGLNATYGRFNAGHLDGFVSGPLTDTLSARLALGLDEGGAWQQSQTRHDSLGDKNLLMGRLILDWRPSDKFEARANINGFTDRSDSQAGQLYGYYFQSPQFISPVTAAQLATPAGYFPNPAFFATYPPQIKAQLAEPMNPSNDRQADWMAGTHPRLNETYWQGSLRMDYGVSDAFALSSITSYERYTQRDRVDIAGEGVETDAGTTKGRVSSVYQEIRAHGEVMEHRLNWLLGFNYEYDVTSEDADFDAFFTSNSYLTGGSPFSLIPIAPFTTVVTPSVVHATTTAVFANVDYKFTPDLIGHAGVRYTKSDQNFASCTGVGEPLNIIFGKAPLECVTLLPDATRGKYFTSLNQSNVPWHVGLDWKFTPNSMAYVSISKGYKAGTTPSLGAETWQQLVPVKQEELLSYEVGLKSELMDRTLNVTAAYFHYDYKNKQELGRYLDPIFGDLQALVNIPASKEDGFELASVWRPIDGLTLNGAVTYLHSLVTSNFINYGPYALGAGDTVNYKGEVFPFTPTWSLNYGARYDWPLNSNLRAFVSLDGSYQTGTTSAFGDTVAHAEGPSLNNRAYWLLNLNAGVQTQDGHWRAELWGKNVTDTYYWYTAYYEFDPVVRYTGMPATYGVTLSYRY